MRVTAVSDQVSITLGTPKTGFKAGADGFNHPDLAAGALFNFFCWPPQKEVILEPGDTLLIEAFVAYQIKGVCKKEGDFSGEVNFSLS